MKRVVVIGTTGSGKSTFAAALARGLDVPHIELDGLFWRPDWVQTPNDEFRAAANAATECPAWVVDGNYLSKLGYVLWQKADTIVWLDMPLPLIYCRLFRRTIIRTVRRTELWTGNREHISHLWRQDSLLRWAARSHPVNDELYSGAMSDPRWKHITFVRLHSLRAARRWIIEACGQP